MKTERKSRRVQRRAPRACSARTRLCVGTERGCMETGPSRWQCTRARGHEGPHVACGVHTHNLDTWPNARPHAERSDSVQAEGRP
jgi:hypothetical protein